MSKLQEKYKAAVNERLEAVLTDVPSRLDLSLSSYSRQALDILVEYSLRPGKRLRGILTSFAYDQASGKAFGTAGLAAAAAVELIQSYLLIIDDVMDQSDLRRGLPTVHKICSKEFGGRSHLANMKAVNIGLLAQHIASMVLADSGETDKNVVTASMFFHRNIAATTAGQLEDLRNNTAARNTSEEDILKMYELKCGYYSFVNPLQTGLALGGVDKPQVMAEVEEYGRAAGAAFQLTDDILGIYSSTAASGKSQSDDIKEGKHTLLIRQALDQTAGADKKFIKSKLGSAGITEKDLEQIRGIIAACGAKDYAAAMAEKYAAVAMSMVAGSNFWSVEAKTFLQEITSYSVSRKH